MTGRGRYTDANPQAIHPATPRRGAAPTQRRAASEGAGGRSLLRERLMAAKKGFGILFFGCLAILYAANFWTVAAKDRGGLGRRRLYETIVETGTAAPALLSQSGVESDEGPLSLHGISSLPGSIASDAKTFEGGANNAPPQGRVDQNALPGAIGMSGPFDNHVVAAVHATPTAEQAPAGAAQAPAATVQRRAAGESKRATRPRIHSGAGPSSSSPEGVVGIASPGTASSPATASVQTAGESFTTVADNQANVLRDGLGHIIRQKKRTKKKKKKRKKRKTKSSPKQGSAAESSVPARHAKDSASSEALNLASSADSDTKATAKAKYEDSPVASDPKPPPADVASISMPPVDVGEHPMSRSMSILQVEGGTGHLKSDAIKKAYKELVKAYLLPFKKGIQRRAFFDILRRKNYSLAPPESNKGIQTILLQIVNKKIYMLDPYEVAKHSKAFYRSRIKEIIWLLGKVAKERDTPDTEFLVAIHDCVQTVSKPHIYRGAHYMESSPTFTIVACNFSDNVPFPMWEGDEQRGGGLRGWDAKMKAYRESDTSPWSEKKNMAVFRGGYRASMYFAEKNDAFTRCDDVGRSRLTYLAKGNPELYDVSIDGKCGAERHFMSRLSEKGHHSYKYILYAEGNCFWADRLNKQVFGPSVIVKQETPCGQFWEPLLRPMTHYIPTDFFFTDTTERIKWANEHSDESQTIVKNANEFASNFLSLDGIESYVEVLLQEYTKLLEVKSVQIEKGSIEVTDGNIAAA